MRDVHARGVSGTTIALTAGLILTIIMILATAVPAHADFGIAGFDAKATNADGSEDTRAAGHPFAATVSIDMNRVTDASGTFPDGNLRDTIVDLPAGFVGNPLAASACPRNYIASTDPGFQCPPASQVGTVALRLHQFGQESEGLGFPLYNVKPRGSDLADFAFAVLGVPIHIISRVSASHGYAVRTTVEYASEAIPFSAVAVTVWGVPADPAHDAERTTPDGLSTGASANIERRPFLTNPSLCGPPLTTTLSADSWQHPGEWRYASSTTSSGPTGCDRLTFSPEVRTGVDTTKPDAPAGLSVDISSPQNDAPDGRGTPPLRNATVTLPEGLTINPGSAAGLEACTDEQLGLGNDAEATCPDGSKIGTVSAESPVLAEPVVGSVYLRPQQSDDPESGEMFRVALVLKDDERGLLVKLPGSVKANATSGHVVAQFRDNPQVPVSHIVVSLKGGPRAPLATPVGCGRQTVDVGLTAWSGHEAAPQDGFDLDCTAGLGGFAPSLAAGTANPVAGAFSPFSLTISKPDGDAPLAGLSMVLPTGLLARLKGNLGTQVGTVKAFAGPGSSPFVLPGQVYLEGAYGDAPFSLKVVVPAKAGPFDLGEVVVRQKIYVDPITAQVTVVSDPVPTIVKGVPARLQRLEVSVDKPNFVVNPTSCAPKSIEGALKSVAGATAALSVRFQVSQCSALDLKPSLGLSLSGKGQTTDGKHPAVTANLTQVPGQANLKKVRVTLPLSLALDPDNANGLCEFVDGSKAEPTCPKASIVGTATATTPILDQPLSGPVYFVKNIRIDKKTGRSIKTLPKLVIPLVGQNGVKLTLTGSSDVVDDQLVTTFDNIPDAPVSNFKLNIVGGKGGILVVSGTDICKATQVADQQIDGQNNKNADADVSIQTPSCPTKVISKKVTAKTVVLKVGGLGAGKVTVTGRGIRKTTKTIAKSTVATITAKRTKGKPGKVTVSFDPTGPTKARKATK